MLNAALSFVLRGCGVPEADFAEMDAPIKRGLISQEENASRLAMGKPDEIITSESLSRIYSSPVEVLKDSQGRVFVVGLEEEVSHPHG